MTFGQQIIALILTPVTVVAVLTFLARTYLKHQFSKDLETFKAELQKSLFEHQTRFSLMREKEAEVIGELYGKIERTASRMASLVHMFQTADGVALSDKKREVAGIGNDAIDYYNEHRIYLDDDTCASIDSVNALLCSAFIYFDAAQPGDEYKPDDTGFWKEAYEKVDKELPGLKKQLRNRFREILYGDAQGDEEAA